MPLYKIKLKKLFVLQSNIDQFIPFYLQVQQAFGALEHIKEKIKYYFWFVNGDGEKRISWNKVC